MDIENKELLMLLEQDNNTFEAAFSKAYDEAYEQAEESFLDRLFPNRKTRKYIKEFIALKQKRWREQGKDEEEIDVLTDQLKEEIKEFRKQSKEEGLKELSPEWKKALITKFLIGEFNYQPLPVIETKLEPMEEGPEPELRLPLEGIIVYLDAGHGGVDGGTPKLTGSRNEKDITRIVVNKMVPMLSIYGLTVELTRKGDENPNVTYTEGNKTKTDRLGWRTNMAMEGNADIFVSIHVNSSTNANTDRIEIFRQGADKEGDVGLSNRIHSSFQKAIESKEIVASGAVVTDKDLHVTRRQKEKTASVLVEIGFMTNKKQEELMNTDAYLEKVAKATAEGIIAYGYDLKSKKR